MLQKLTGGQALVAGLQRWNTDTLFGLPGVHLDHFFAALYPVKNKIRILHSRHEQGAAYMALGYAMVSGRPGIFTVVPGPGLLNTTSALATAYACNAPVLCITSTVNRPLLDKNYGSLHEIPDQPGVLAGLTKWSARANHAAEIPELIDEAFRQMLSGRPRPVALEVPPEILGQVAMMQFPEEKPTINHPTPDPEKINAAAKLIGSAKEPLIIVGGGAQDAGREVLQLAELLQAPVISRQMGRGIVSDEHHLSIQASAGHQLWKTADLVIGIGTRLQHVREWGIDDDLKVIRIDLDPLEMARVAPPTIDLVADSGEASQALYDVLKKQKVSRVDQSAKFKSIKQEFRKELERTITRQVEYLDVIRDALPENGILVDELTQVGHVTKLALPVYNARSLLTSGYQGTLGYGFATAIGAQVAAGDRKVLSINGDGGFMYTMPELASAVLHNIPIVALVFCDKSFGNVEAIQQRWYDGNVIATRLHNPDFVAMAESFGALGLKADSPEELRTAIDTAFQHQGPAVIEIPVTVEEMGWPWSLIIKEKVRS